MKIQAKQLWGTLSAVCLVAGCQTAGSSTDGSTSTTGAAVHEQTGVGYNMGLQATLDFNPIQPGSDIDHGRAVFGLAADDNTIDTSEAIFTGFSQAYGGELTSNGRVCASCHRGGANHFGLPPLPLTSSVSADDPLITGFTADADGDPDAYEDLVQYGLVRYRPGRFNLARSEDDPYRQVFFWRKVQRLVNLRFEHGFLNDGRARVMFETCQGAAFTHTQATDQRFDDLFSLQDGVDLEAFQFADTLSDPTLAALANPSDPLHDTLVSDPFYTVPIRTQAQRRGSQVFQQYCMTCHNVPNVFNNIWNVEPLGNNARPVTDPAFAPSVGKNFDIGVAEANRLHLDFRLAHPDGTRTTIVLPLANEDGTTTNYPVTFDVGLAATTARRVDVGRFRVPQLRDIKDLGPYFHDNSATTLTDVINYFNSAQYNTSRDGQRYPIHLDARQRSDLLEFLNVL
jgi:hypothetical protein